MGLARSSALLAALVCAACAPTWTGRYAPLNGGWTPAHARRDVELRLEQRDDGRVLGELRSGVRSVGLSLRAADERALVQSLELQDILVVPLQTRDGDGPPVITGERRLDPDPYQLTLERGDGPSLLLLRLSPPAGSDELEVHLVRLGE